MTVNPVRNRDGTTTSTVPADNSKGGSGVPLVMRKSRSEYPLCGSISNGVKRLRSEAAVTFIEVIAAMVILAVAVIGAGGYRYYCVLDARKADVQITAARLASTLLESWRNTSDPNTFDPTDPTQLANPPQLTIVAGPAPAVPTGFTESRSYVIVVGGLEYRAVLSWKDIPLNTPQVPPGLRALNVIVVRPQRQDSILVKLTTYTLQ